MDIIIGLLLLAAPVVGIWLILHWFAWMTQKEKKKDEFKSEDGG